MKILLNWTSPAIVDFHVGKQTNLIVEADEPPLSKLDNYKEYIKHHDHLKGNRWSIVLSPTIPEKIKMLIMLQFS